MRIDVTIGIPVYKSVDYIERTMLSALSQSFSNIEFLIVDDCGNDGTMDKLTYIKETHPRGKFIRILHNFKNEGVGYCRNRIIDEAQGDYLYFMDSDDYIESETIEILFNAIKKSKCQIAYASYDIIDLLQDNEKKEYIKDRCVLNHKGALAYYAFKNMNIFHVSVCNSLVNLKFLRNSETRFLNYQYWEDMAYTYELVTKVDTAVLLPSITYHYLRRPGSLSHYQKREIVKKEEVQKNVFLIGTLKKKCLELKDKSYTPFMCYNIEMVCFYMVCHILRHMEYVLPRFSNKELRSIMHHPLSLFDIIQFREKKYSNIFMYFLGRFPVCLFVLAVRIVCRIKNV
jgi:glycosyltransferase involved in cell wall biosynthesis